MIIIEKRIYTILFSIFGWNVFTIFPMIVFDDDCIQFISSTVKILTRGFIDGVDNCQYACIVLSAIDNYSGYDFNRRK